MKKIYTLVLFSLLANYLGAQTLVLSLNGDLPTNSFPDLSGSNNTVVKHGNVTKSGGAIIFAAGTDYLSIDTLTSAFNINDDWRIDCKIRMEEDSTDEVCIIDFRSTSLTGNMYFYYNLYEYGLHFGDRNINGEKGYLVADRQLLPQGEWVTVELIKENGHLKILRDGVVTADTVFTGTLSPVSTTTIGYSEDRRAAHKNFYMEHLKLFSLGPTGIKNPVAEPFANVYPNPAAETAYLHIEGGKMLERTALFNICGGLIRESVLPEIFMGDLSPGIYFLQAEFTDGKNSRMKVIK